MKTTEAQRRASSKWTKANKDKVNADQRRRAAANRERKAQWAKKWNDANRDSVRAAWVKWSAENPEKIRELKMRRRASEAVPAWGNRPIMRSVYAVAKAWRLAGFPVHVDHVVPLRGRDACGLHVEHNLNIVFAEDNLRKHNKLLEGVS